MCGIAGVLYADPARPADPAVLKAKGDAIAHQAAIFVGDEEN